MQNTGPPNYQGMMGQGMNYSSQYENQMVCPQNNYMYPQTRPAYRQPRQLYNNQTMHAGMGYNNSPQRHMNYHQPAAPQNQYPSQDQYASMYPTERKQQWQQQQQQTNNNAEMLGAPQMVSHRGIPHNSIPQSPHHYHQMGTAVSSPWPQQAQIPSPRMMGASPCTSPHHAPSAPPPSASQQCMPPNNPLQSLQKMVLQDGSKADIPPSGYGVINHDSRNQQAYYPSPDQDQNYRQTYYNLDQNKLCNSPNNIASSNYNTISVAVIPEPVLDGLIPPSSSTASSSYEKQHCHHPMTSDVIPNPDSFPPMDTLVSNPKAFHTTTESILLQPMEKLIPIPATGATAETIILDKKLDNGNQSSLIPDVFQTSILHSCNSELGRQANVDLQPLLLHDGLEASKFPIEAKLIDYEVTSNQMIENKWQSKTNDFNSSFKDLTPSESIPESTELNLDNSYVLDKEIQISISPIADTTKDLNKSPILPINGTLENGSTEFEKSPSTSSNSLQTTLTKSPHSQITYFNASCEIVANIKPKDTVPTSSLVLNIETAEATVVPAAESDILSESSLLEKNQHSSKSETKILEDEGQKLNIPEGKSQKSNILQGESQNSNIQDENKTSNILQNKNKTSDIQLDNEKSDILKENEKSDILSVESQRSYLFPQDEAQKSNLVQDEDQKSNLQDENHRSNLFQDESQKSNNLLNESENGSKVTLSPPESQKQTEILCSISNSINKLSESGKSKPTAKDKNSKQSTFSKEPILVEDGNPESLANPESNLVSHIPKKKIEATKPKIERKTRSKQPPQKRQTKIRPVEQQQKSQVKNKRTSEKAKPKKIINKTKKSNKNVASIPSTSTELEQTSQTVRSKKSVSSGPFVRVKGSKLNPISVTVINMPPKENEEVAKEKPIKRKRDQGSDLAGRKKLGIIHTSTLSPSYDAITKDKSWMCMFCHRGSHFQTLGDLFGPYYLNSETPIFKTPLEADAPSACRNLRSKRKRSGSIEEVPKSPKKPKLTKKQKSIEEDSTEINPTTTKDSNPKEFWIHEECVIWTPGIFMNGETIQGLEQAVSEATQVTCAKCKLNGASLSCVTRGCTDQYHFLCSVTKGCLMEESNYTIVCPKHKASSSKASPENTRAHKALCFKKKGMLKKPNALL